MRAPERGPPGGGLRTGVRGLSGRHSAAPRQLPVDRLPTHSERSVSGGGSCGHGSRSPLRGDEEQVLRPPRPQSHDGLALALPDPDWGQLTRWWVTGHQTLRAGARQSLVAWHPTPINKFRGTPSLGLGLLDLGQCWPRQQAVWLDDRNLSRNAVSGPARLSQPLLQLEPSAQSPLPHRSRFAGAEKAQAPPVAGCP